MSEFARVIGNQLRLNGENRRPLNHYLCGDANVLETASNALHKDLPSKGLLILPDITHEVEPRDLRFQGKTFFKSLYEALEEVDGKESDPLLTVQPVVVPDISRSYVGYESSSQPANHLFCQIPLEGNDTKPSFVEQILRDRPSLPRVVVLHHLGYLAGQEAYDIGYIDIGVGHFKDGLWDTEELRE